MATNEIYPFGTGGTTADGDVMELAEYLADDDRLDGHQLGIARRELMNTTLRQVSHMAAGLAQFIANRYLSGVVDDADLAKIENGLTAAIVDIIENTPHDHFTSEITDLLSTQKQYSVVQSYAQVDLAINAGAVTWDMRYPNAVLYLSGDVTSFTMTNPIPGTTPQLTILRDGNGTRTLALPSSIKWQGGALPELTQEANSEDVLAFPIRDSGGTPVIRGHAALNFGTVS